MAAPNTAWSIASGYNLHVRIIAEAKTVLGIDRTLDGRECYPPDDAHHEIRQADVCEPNELKAAVADRQIDVIVAGEILEHLINSGLCLLTLAELRPAATLLVTVPNALSRAVADGARRGVETVHADHVCWYSPRTLTRLLELTGWTRIKLFALGNQPVRHGPGNAACPAIGADCRTS